MARKPREIGRLEYISGPRIAGKPREYADTPWYVSGKGSWGSRWGDHNFDRLQELSKDREVIFHFMFYNPDTDEWRLSRPQSMIHGDMSASAFGAFMESYEDDGYEVAEMLYTYL